ncbi:subtilisin-like protease TgSUB2, putative [Eimeria mitis]|uniref:subtilisin n=1 Tax=Eimeria mitis TaxID=44415 RepID=U6KDN9_9EIME|nr:subtilisin-like protease TgSUB2, putative [Eimeria mitis]CDJ36074.1 subtilisin-like protease TgSUB2, putative [Eimeria mitis]
MDRAVFSSLADDRNAEPFGSDPLMTRKPAPEQRFSDGSLGEKTQILAVSQGDDATPKSAVQGQHRELHSNSGSPVVSETATPADAAFVVASGSATSATSATLSSGVSSVDSEGEKPPVSRDRTQDVGVHRFDAVEETNSGQGSMLDENTEAPATTRGRPTMWTWNPLNPGDEPTEAEDLKHEGVPGDFVSIPVLDQAAGHQSEQAEDVAAPQTEAPAEGYDNSATSSNSAAASGQAAEEEQEDTNQKSSSGKYRRQFEKRVAESRTSDLPDGESSSASSKGSDQANEESNAASHAPDATTVDGSISESESGSIGRGSAKDSSNHSSTADNSSNSNRNGSSSSSTTEQDVLSHAGRSGFDSYDYHTSGRGVARSKRRSRFASPSELSGESDDSLYTPWSPVTARTGRSASGEAAVKEEETVSRKTECVYKVAGVRIDASYVDTACTGTIHVAYQSEQGKFMQRRLLLSNTTEDPVTVVMKTVNAKFKASVPAYSSSYYRSFSGPYSFLQGEEGGDTDSTTTAAAEEKAADYIRSMLKEMRRVRRKLPNRPLDLVVGFTSPLDGSSEGTDADGTAASFMQTSAGAARIAQSCDEVLSVLEDREGFSCEILEAVDVIILQFPPSADLSDKGEVEKVLSKLLSLEGRNILFFEVAKPASLQMAPVGEGLPDPPKRLTEKWAFVQAKEALQEQCSAEATAKTRLLSEDGDADSPVAANLPQDPDLEKRLWGMYSARCVHAWLHGEKGHKEVVVAVIDSGVASHPDLDENIWHNAAESADGGDEDNNGFIDDTDGWNFADDSNHVVDTNGHGTHVAGTVGGVANNKDIVGCSPLVSIMKIQQFGSSGTGSIGDAVRGVAYAMLHGVEVINNSWGATETTDSLQLLMERSQAMRGGLGTLIVNAAGNSSSNNDLLPFYPAGFDYPNTIS